MNTKNKIFKCLLLGCMLFFLSMNIFPLIVANRLSLAYEEQGTNRVSLNESLEGLIIDGGGFYMEATGYINQILKIAELQNTNGIDYGALELALADSLTNLQKAKIAYERLISEASNTPYNNMVLTALKSFPYDNFRLSEGVNAIIFDKLELLLKEGDITGILKNIYHDFISLEVLLLNLRNELLTRKSLNSITVMELNELTSNLSLFGSYVARIFSKF